MDKNQELIDFLNKVPLLACLEQNEIEKLLANARLHSYEKGDYIFKKHSFPNTLFIIWKGCIQEIGVDSNDFATVVKNRHEYDYLGEVGVLLDEPYISTARALSRTVLLGIPREYFSNLVFNNKRMIKFIIKTLSSRLQNSAEKDISFLMFNSEGRVAYRLLMMYREMKEDHPGTEYIETTQEALSQLCGVARQTVSNVFSGWKASGMIETHRGGIELLDKDKLIEVFLSNAIIR